MALLLLRNPLPLYLLFLFMYCVFISLGALRFCAYHWFLVVMCNGIVFFMFLVLGICRFIIYNFYQFLKILAFISSNIFYLPIFVLSFEDSNYLSDSLYEIVTQLTDAVVVFFPQYIFPLGFSLNIFY